MCSKALKTAVIGLGIGEQHANAVLEDINCELSHIVDFDEHKVHAFLQKHNLTSTDTSSFDDVINSDDVKLVSIASFDDHHFDQVLKALEAGKHVFVEKPLCQSKEQLKAIVAKFQESTGALASNLVLRTAPLYQHIKNLIEQDDLGEIYAFDGDYLYGRIHKITEGWRKDVSNYSVMEGGGIHIIDLMLWFMGEEPESVSSCTNKIATKDTNFKYPDFHSSIFKFKNGAIGRITANFGCVHPHQHVIRVFGTKGTFIYDDRGARFYKNREEPGSPEILKQAPKPTKKGLLIHEFVKSILKNDFRKLAIREFNLMSVVLAADEAIKSETPIKVEYITC